VAAAEGKAAEAEQSLLTVQASLQASQQDSEGRASLERDLANHLQQRAKLEQDLAEARSAATDALAQFSTLQQQVARMQQAADESAAQ